MEKPKEENLAYKAKRDESMRRAGVDDDGWSGEHGVEECCAGLVWVESDVEAGACHGEAEE